jgi:hypothetical protein
MAAATRELPVEDHTVLTGEVAGVPTETISKV